jgi:hypothetical protein
LHRAAPVGHDLRNRHGQALMPGARLGALRRRPPRDDHAEADDLAQRIHLLKGMSAKRADQSRVLGDANAVRAHPAGFAFEMGHAASPSTAADNNMICETRNAVQVLMPRNAPPSWTFLTRHAQVLLCIADDPGIRLRDIGDRVGITERAAHRIVGELADAGYIARRRVGRRNHYTVRPEQPLPDPVARDQRVGALLDVLVTRRSAPSPG